MTSSFLYPFLLLGNSLYIVSFVKPSLGMYAVLLPTRSCIAIMSISCVVYLLSSLFPLDFRVCTLILFPSNTLLLTCILYIAPAFSAIMSYGEVGNAGILGVYPCLIKSAITSYSDDIPLTTKLMLASPLRYLRVSRADYRDTIAHILRILPSSYR